MRSQPVFLQITSGRGPVECARVVALVLEMILKAAREAGLLVDILEREPGPPEFAGTLRSASIRLEGGAAEAFAVQWTGTLQWISKSPYRKLYKRKNWFIGIQRIQIPEAGFSDEKDLRYDTLRASGPGGQHVNKTESAVRAVHIPSGLWAMASDERSQARNKKLARERLYLKLANWQADENRRLIRENWDQHNTLERGNPMKVINQPL
ncbi:peptide chain release factor H [Desulfosarcina sp. OttesenSCG-928-G10]|nr:peptide chain release factor H [Desulfosarcina sp. OttesenSCG-928-G10]MDL2321941.1 peptide chain release factor H [Desulfosarcina sp. OttesenSCG-928-B08]